MRKRSSRRSESLNEPGIIALKGLAIGYARRPVLRDMDVAVRRGAFVGLLGANGSGKTTLLKTIARIVPPVQGTVMFAPANAVAGYVPQRESLDAPFLLSSVEVVQMGLCGRIGPARPLGRAGKDRAMECMRETGTDDLAGKPFALLSGGQKQRVLIARALAAAPDILLLDEPTAGVDPQATEAISQLLRRLHQKGMTILMVNHDLPVVRAVTDTVFWLRRGKLEVGATGEMLSEAVLERISLQLE